jgi:hypothetical protein
MRLLIPACALAAALVAAPASSTPLRCNGRIIDEGMSAFYALTQCGEPLYTRVERGPVWARTRTGLSRIVGSYEVEHWYYDRGYGRFPAVLKITNGRIKKIEFLPHRSE